MRHLLNRMRLTQPSISFLIPQTHVCVCHTTWHRGAKATGELEAATLETVLLYTVYRTLLQSP